MSEERKEIKMVVAAVNAAGEPDFYFCKVKCNEAELDDGEHYEAAKAVAEKEGYEPRLAFDEMDSGGRAILDVFEWGTADVIDLADGYLRTAHKPKMSF
jgi:hypothetical protein